MTTCFKILKYLGKYKSIFNVKCMIRVNCASGEEKIGDKKLGQQVKIYGRVLKSSQVNALILIFYIGLKSCHEDLLTYVARDEGYRYLFQMVFST